MLPAIGPGQRTGRLELVARGWRRPGHVDLISGCGQRQFLAGHRTRNPDGKRSHVRLPDHIKFRFVRGKANAVRPGHVRDHLLDGGIAVRLKKAIDVQARLKTARKGSAAGQRQAAVVSRVREPDGSIGFDRKIVRRIELRPIRVLGEQRRGDAVGHDGHPECGATGLARNQSLVEVEQIAIILRVGGWPEEIGESVGRHQFFEPVTADVAEDQITAIRRNPNHALDPRIQRRHPRQHRIRRKDLSNPTGSPISKIPVRT